MAPRPRLTSTARATTSGGGATGTDTCHSRAKPVSKGTLLKGTRMQDLPCGDIKIVLRPRGGLRVSDVTCVELSCAIAAAAQIPANEASEDVVCLNLQQNIFVVSTPKRDHTNRYAAMGRIDIRGTAHEVSAYEAAPHGTVKGVIRGIPLEDTAQEIQTMLCTCITQRPYRETKSVRPDRSSLLSKGTKYPVTRDTTTCSRNARCTENK